MKLILSCVGTVTFMTLGQGREDGLVSTAVKLVEQLEEVLSPEGDHLFSPGSLQHFHDSVICMQFFS